MAGALLLAVPVAALVYGVRKFRTEPRSWTVFCLGCVALIVPWCLALLEKARIVRIGGTPSNVFEKAVNAAMELFSIASPVGVVLLVVAFVMRSRAAAPVDEQHPGEPADPGDPAPRKATTVRLWPVLVIGACATVAAAVIGYSIPVDDASPSFVQGTVDRVDDQLSTFVFKRDGLDLSGVGNTYPLDNPMWVDHTGQKHLNSRPECLTTPLTHPARVELALLDVQGNPDAGFGNYRLLFSVRCLDRVA
ncbi:hypothetical protein [Actinokineospora diospyrosa]|uniref:MmpS family membrane protein n=1 Tax=Actinokineospora diospyrosa TaxID=103728 RepID=A0ABT1INC7_9PSEU|nr:hypothetical protein [Actinokineospora diospyrosa]MCP2274180.1 hypothetical protein [Actinokineospora diospyrosa]